MIMKMARVARSRKLGILHPAFHMSRYLRTELHKDLPDNVHQLVSGRLGISLTRVADGKNVLVSHFRTKSEVVDVSGGAGLGREGLPASQTHLGPKLTQPMPELLPHPTSSLGWPQITREVKPYGCNLMLTMAWTLYP